MGRMQRALAEACVSGDPANATGLPGIEFLPLCRQKAPQNK